MAPPAAARSASIELDLDRVEDLFELEQGNMLRERPRLYSGIEELIGRLDARPVRRPRIVIRVPEGVLRPDTQARLQLAVLSYCDHRLDHTRRSIHAERREGLRALALGIVLFTIGFFLARAVSSIVLDADVRSFLADGVFLVFAWVGLWYPLDALIYYPMRQRRDQRLLRLLRTAHIDVTTSNHGGGVARNEN